MGRAGVIPRTGLPVAVPAGSAVLSALAAHAQARPESTAAAAVAPDGSPSRVMTFRRLCALAGHLSRELSDAGATGDVVLLVGAGGPEFVAWLMAALAAGARVLPVHLRSTPAEVADLVERSGATTVIAPAGAPTPTGLRILPFEGAADERGQGPSPGGARQAGAIVLASSGTTGRSNLALREAPALDADAANVARATAMGPGDRVLLGVPCGHSYGVDMIVAGVLSGAALLITDPFDARAASAALVSQATILPAVPFMLEALARVPPEGGSSRPRLVFSAGSPLPPRVARAFERAWGRRPGQLYGASELGSVTFCHPDSASFAEGSVGVAMTGVSIRVLDPDRPARCVPVGEEGHVGVAAPSMFSGYLDGESPLADGHFLTGDLGRLDEAGRLYLTGRLKHVIDVGGLKVNPQEVEGVLAAHPGVAECVVVATEASDTVTRLRAVFVARDPARTPTDADLRAFLKERLSGHKVPRVFEAAPSLPRSPTGKVLRAHVAGPGC